MTGRSQPGGRGPGAAARARERYSCFDHAGADSHDYARSAAFGAGETCEDKVVTQRTELCLRAADYAQMDRRVAEDELFHAERNARLVANAEQYYRTMFASRVQSWNLRDRHMAETLDAHNSHLGDARATEMSRRGELNVGQLVRQRHGDEAVLVGFSTYSGTVTAAHDWGQSPTRMQVRPALPNSYEVLFHQLDARRFLLPLTGDSPAAQALRSPRLERAIGVSYRPETERASHYVEARLADQFDAVVHVGSITAVEPLEPGRGWEDADAPRLSLGPLP